MNGDGIAGSGNRCRSRYRLERFCFGARIPVKTRARYVIHLRITWAGSKDDDEGCEKNSHLLPCCPVFTSALNSRTGTIPCLR